MSVVSRRSFFQKGLYLVANWSSYRNFKIFGTKIEKLRGEIDCAQVRIDEGDFAHAVEVASFAKSTLGKTPLFINTLRVPSWKVAQKVGAQGVYLENGELSEEARGELGEKAIIGVPVKTGEELEAAGQNPEIDYVSMKIGLSKRTCPRNDVIWGDEWPKAIQLAQCPVVVIGGMNIGCAEEVYRHLRPGDAIAMAGGLMEVEDPFSEARKIQEIYRKTRGEA